MLLKRATETTEIVRSYEPDDPTRFVGEVECSPEEARAHFPDGLADHGFLQARLTRVLSTQDTHEAISAFPLD